MTNSTVTLVFFFNDTATTEIYTLSLHDALPISAAGNSDPPKTEGTGEASGTTDEGAKSDGAAVAAGQGSERDRERTRLDSSHSQISYAVFCLKKKKKIA